MTYSPRFLQIFISSAMQNENKPERKPLLDVRASLDERLNEYSFIQSYILEQEPSSPLPLNATFTTRLRHADWIIFLLDSRHQMPSGVQAEITDARRQNIPRVYFILPGAHDEGEKMKTEILNQDETNFVNVLPKSDDYAADIEQAVLIQFVSVFQAYSSHIIVPIENTATQSDQQAEPLNAISSQFSKNVFNKTGISRQFIREIVFHEESENRLTDPQSGIDQSVFNLLNRIFANKPLPYSWDLSLLEAIKTANAEEPLSDELLTVIKTRLKAVTQYFSKNYDLAYETLQQLLKTPEIADVPNWIVQDILIDLRNILYLKGKMTNQIQRNNPHQSKLNEISTPFFYPGIDHSLNIVLSWVRKENNAHNTATSSEVSSYGAGIFSYTDTLTDAETYAVCNGSITQIRQLPNNLNIISEMLLQRFEEKTYLVDLVQNKLLMGTTYKKISRWLHKYSYLQGQFTDTDAMRVFNVVQSYPIEIEKLKIEAIFLRIFGNYLSDKNFNNVWSSLLTQINTWKTEVPLILDPANDILGLFRNCFRIPQQDVINFVSTFSEIAPRYRDNVADIIAFAIDYDSASEKQKNELTAVLQKQIESIRDGTISSQMESAILTLLTCWPSHSGMIVDYFKKTKPDFFNGNLKPYLWNKSEEEEFSIFVNKQIELMKSDNTNQTASSSSMLGTDAFSNIRKALMDGNKLKKTQARAVMGMIVETLNHPYQTIQTKLSAVKLMMVLSNRGYNYSNLVGQIDTDALSANSISMFEVNNPTKFVVALKNFIEMFRKLHDNNAMLLTLTLSQDLQYLTFVSQLLIDFIPIALNSESLSSTLPQILQFLITNNNPHHLENQLISKVSKCFLKFSSDKRFSDVVIGQIQKLVSDTNNVVLRQLVVQINSLPASEQKNLESIKNQLLSNTSYSVRDLASRDFLNTKA